ncbi:Transcriptional regulator ATRX like [Actinidia chinensis var. chinensis]|uniref:Transcriptional regulator ATRX like n=1 Tax=Actinidia chinensis var. chinensis TaxID=1590841 RepID=A0A2R6QH54_ACTCC|nr:Transcriptional regulator ATRX like [Actinidia chinensis var. chinensis]
MAEEKLDISENPEKIVIEGDHTRRNSTGNLRISKRMKVLPRYLSDSVSSCHDYCKYGIKHELEKKPRNSVPKRITERSGKDQDQVENVNLEAKKKKSVISRRPLGDSKSKTTEEHKIAKENTLVLAKKTAALVDSRSQTTEEHKITKKSTHVLAKKTSVSSKPVFAPGDRNDVSAKHTSDSRDKTLQTKPSSFSTPGSLSSRKYREIVPHKAVGDVQVSPAGGSRSRGQSDIITSKEIKVSRVGSEISTNKEMKGSKVGKKSDLLRPRVSPSPKPSTKRESIAKFECRREPKQASHVKCQRSISKAGSKQPVEENAPEKTLYVIETKPDDPTVGLTQNGNGTAHSSQNPSQSPPSTKSRRLRHTRNDIPISRSSSSSSLSSGKKSLRLIKTGNSKAESSSSSLSLLSSSSSASESMNSDGSDPTAEGSGTKSDKQIASHKADHTSRPRQVRKVISTDKIGSPRKLHFTRGKVIEIQARNESPRRLRFKQRKVLDENQNGKADTEVRKLKQVVAIGDLPGSETKPTNVVLRHQDVEGKKGGQILLNNVIEETANKLEQTRKSKVKALVGAFETLISLHDTNSSAAKGT